MKTMLVLPTTAGLALLRSLISKKRVIVLDRGMISPFMRQSFRLSSNTVFKFSIQEESTGPSKTSHFRSSVDDVAISLQYCYKRFKLFVIQFFVF